MTRDCRTNAARGAVLLVAALLCGGCASSSLQKKTVTASDTVAETVSTPDIYPEEIAAIRRSADEPTGMTIGLALSGGGSKAAPFALGVLAGLQEADVLDEVDAISSVSGGSYAALYYFARLVREGHDPSFDRDQLFWDCIPLQRKRVLSQNAPNVGEYWRFDEQNYQDGYCPEGLGVVKDGVYWQPNVADWSTDPLRYASHLRGHQDVFGDGFDYRGDDGSLSRLIWSGAKLVAVNTIVLGAPNFFANLLFDWRLDLSPSKSTYANGIVRGWGRTPASPPTLSDHRYRRGPGDPHSIAALTFDELRFHYETGQRQCVERTNCNFPLWIINATAGVGNSLNFFDRTKYTGEKNGFEFTPFGYGAEAFGRYPWRARELEPRLSVAEAVGASAAFFDSQQRSKGGAIFGPVFNLLLRLANFDWGTDIPNYRLTRQRAELRTHQRSVLPFPFYMFFNPVGDTDGVAIRLSDGGQSENLGVVSLLRREVTQIVVVDAAEDKAYRLDDLCSLHNQLKVSKQPRSVAIFDIKDFPENCGKSRDPFQIKGQLPQPILKGGICEGTQKCTADKVDVELFILKPALNYHARHDGGPSLDELRQESPEGGYPRIDIDECSGMERMYPCEVVAFLRSNKADNPFPQHSTAGMTANSSPFLYGAYRELGRYYARQLEIKNKKLVVKPSPWLLAESNPTAGDSKGK